MKSSRRQTPLDTQTEIAVVPPVAVSYTASQEITVQPEQISQETEKEVVQPAASTELRTRIKNAVKTIKGLGGEVGDVNRSDTTDEELQTELEELTQQYKRLKSSKGK